MKATPSNNEEQSPDRVRYVSGSQLAGRWDCAYTTAQRITERAGIGKYFLGEGKNGMVRYRLDEIDAYEKARHAGALAR